MVIRLLAVKGKAILGESKSMSLVTKLSVSLPEWLIDDVNNKRVPERLVTSREQMAFAIALSRRNSTERTGGPFGTVIVESESGLVKAVGVNVVVPSSCSLAHGEALAIAMAQAAANNYNLGAPGLPALTLVTSSQTCVQCFGAVVWSGVRKLICAASGEDVERLVGFDEGPIHPQWRDELRARGIEVVQGLMRDEACAVLDWYYKNGGVVYNSR